MSDFYESLNIGDYRDGEPVFIQSVPADTFEVFTNEGRVFYDLEMLLKSMGPILAQNAAINLAYGTDEQVARSHGHFDVLETIGRLHGSLLQYMGEHLPTT